MPPLGGCVNIAQSAGFIKTLSGLLAGVFYSFAVYALGTCAVWRILLY